MKRAYWLYSALFAVAAAIYAAIPPAVPKLPWLPPAPPESRAVEIRPAEVFPGEIATVYGFGLEAANVGELWLVRGKIEIRAEIIEQTSRSILFRLPAWVPEGRWQIALLGHEMLVDQDVYLWVKPHRGPPTG